MAKVTFILHSQKYQPANDWMGLQLHESKKLVYFLPEIEIYFEIANSVNILGSTTIT